MVLRSAELVVRLLPEVSLDFEEEDPQAETAKTSPRTATTVSERRMRLLRGRGVRRDGAVMDDKGVLRRGSWCTRVGRQFTPSSPLKRARSALLMRDSQNFQQYIHIHRPLKPLLMRPLLVLVRKAFDRMWFRRHWYWPSGYLVVGIIVALLTNNIHLSSLSGVLLSILAVLLWPFILGAALCRLLGFHIPGIKIT